VRRALALLLIIALAPGCSALRIGGVNLCDEFAKRHEQALRYAERLEGVLPPDALVRYQAFKAGLESSAKTIEAACESGEFKLSVHGPIMLDGIANALELVELWRKYGPGARDIGGTRAADAEAARLYVLALRVRGEMAKGAR